MLFEGILQINVARKDETELLVKPCENNRLEIDLPIPAGY